MPSAPNKRLQIKRVADGLVSNPAANRTITSFVRRALMSDFGIAKALGDISDPETTQPLDLSTAAGTILGTLAYIAPEQAGGEIIDERKS